MITDRGKDPVLVLAAADHDLDAVAAFVVALVPAFPPMVQLYWATYPLQMGPPSACP